MFGIKKSQEEAQIPGIMGMGDDYHIYRMSIQDRLEAVGMGIGVGVAIGYVFFENVLAAV